MLTSPIVFSDEERGLEVWIDDDGRAAYALMCSLGSAPAMLGGVWLYNSPNAAAGGPRPHGKHAGLDPNPPEHIVDEPFEPIAADDEVDVEFGGGSGLEAYAEISIRSTFHAYLEARARTGWCILAKKSNALAKPMIVTRDADGSDDVHLVDYDGDSAS